jgi:hypothetical protein
MVGRIRMRALGAFAFACIVSVAVAVPQASALSKTAREASRMGAVSDGATRAPLKAPSPSYSPFGLKHHGFPVDHLPPVQQNMDLIGELNLISPSTGLPVKPGQVADVAVHKGYAYLNSWDSTTCQDGGTFVVDIRNPASPKQIGFIPAQAPYYHGEGAHVISVSTPQFTGDILAVNDETYGSNVTAPCAPVDKTGGGFDLYNVTDPANPVPLVQGAGDRSPEGSTVQNPAIPGNSYHSVFIWQDGPKAYLVASDNTELADVDIFDITDPTNPEFINDLDLFSLPPADVDNIVSEGANGQAIFHHDVVVKKIAGQERMLISYWDAGYVQLDVDDPANATYITDTDFDDPDPLSGQDPPEGNAHEAEYSSDGQFMLAADEDFSQFRLIAKINDAPYANDPFSAALSAAHPIAPGELITGDTVFVGDGCAPLTVAPTPTVTVAVAERGTCDFQVKADNIDNAGFDMGIIMNNNGVGDGARCDVLINMLIDDDEDTVGIPMVFVGRETGFRILDSFDENTYQCSDTATPVGDTVVPAVGTQGLSVDIGSVFDGWGYTHLYDANTSEELDAYAIPEGMDERYANGFGDLTVHEFATDPTTNLAYSSYYAGGMRVFRFSRAGGLEPVGKFIDEDGSNFWGVEAFTDAAGNRLIAGSDRDFGLQIFKYTGPGAVLAPPPPPPPVAPPPAGPPAAPPPPPAVVKTPPSFFTFQKSARVTYSRSTRRTTASITVPGAGKATATVRAPIGRRVVTLSSASGTATKRGTMRFTFRLSTTNARLLRSTLARKRSGRTAGTLRVTFTPTGGTKRTRNKSLSIGMR